MVVPRRQPTLEPEMYFEFVDVTPTMASGWLLPECNEGNRRIRKLWVSRMADDIAQGLWRVTHHAIAFNPKGVLRDGQHRLLAIVRSECTASMWVAYNVPDEAVVVMDCGDKRALVDVAHYGGVDVTNREVAIANAMVAGMSANWHKKSRQHMLGFITAHHNAIAFAVKVLSPKRSGFSHASIGATFARAYYHTEHTILERAAHILMVGTPPNDKFLPGDKAMLTLRTFVLSSLSFTGRRARYAMYLKAQRAIYAFVQRQDITRLFDAREEYFPLPDEQHGELSLL